MTCPYKEQCGGCLFRNLSFEEYKNQKIKMLQDILKNISEQNFIVSEPFFVGDGQRRRASFAFQKHKDKVVLGYNERSSSNVTDIKNCCLLTSKINSNLQNIHTLAEEICSVSYQAKNKNKKAKIYNISSGDIIVTEASNGLDIVLEFDAELNLECRMKIFEQAQFFSDIIRISHRRKAFDTAEVIIEKTRPIIKIAGYDIYIPAGTFLQASEISEKELINTVLKFVGNTEGKIADLFCGVGTFSYPLSQIKNTKILAVDSSEELLSGFKNSVNKNMISNIEIKAKNLFKYPLDETELKEVNVVVFDPPRAGAKAQAEKLAAMQEHYPEKIIAVSCNPHSFVNDAKILISGGYNLKEIKLIDQFNYSNHSELVALFTK